jgi:aspartyl/asparaginyl-tRNA synthetase
MTRLFDHKKQYVCTEVFRLEDLQKQAGALEEIALDDEVDFPLYRDLMDVHQTINEFIKYLEEQKKRK